MVATSFSIEIRRPPRTTLFPYRTLFRSDMRELLRQGYRGSRYSFGYPACPNLADQAPLLELLGASRIGVELGEEWQLRDRKSTGLNSSHVNLSFAVVAFRKREHSLGSET